ncbi:unnamed protein product [Cyclocybe aegerita]|uniref:F-box domain-containing protein n=1 Tax=Cyclocybe aegerita TaxID=1973307 RepID=A0A8S0WIZ6_CYCAE|nr:unnamed protein product [Cyclocybe aegerita]
MQTCPNCGIDVLNIPKTTDLSPIASLLTTNNPPEPQDEAIASELIASSAAWIVQIDGLITQVHHILDGLISCRAEYEYHSHLHKNVIRNIRRIPAEILVEIFLQTIIDSDPNDIWAVIKVCRHWREVALAAPTLWSIFPFNPSILPTAILSCLSRSLQLSRPAPLNLSISGKPSYPICPLQFFISPDSKQITGLTVHDPLHSSQSKLFWSSNPLLVQWDSLRSLKLQFPSAEPLGAVPITVFQHAPLLQDVDLNFTDRQNISSIMSNVLLPWSQLCKLSISNTALDGVFTILQVAPELEECHIESTDRSMPSNIPTLSHQFLMMLHVTVWNTEVTHGIFHHLTLPSLRKLSVDGCALDISVICALIKRSSCRLTFLNLPTANPLMADDSPSLQHLFSLLPDVTELCIYISLASFDRIGARLAPMLLPQLRHLCLEGTGSSKRCDLAALRNIAYTNVLPLETIIFTTEGRPLYELIPHSPNYKDPQIRILHQWNCQLVELTRSIHDVGAMKDDSAFHRDLSRILSLMSSESETGMSGEYLCHKTGRGVFSRLQGLLEQVPESLHLCISAILALWLPRIQEYKSYRWMENSLARTTVYTRRQGSLYVKVRDREKDRFASFGLKDGHLTLPLRYYG